MTHVEIIDLWDTATQLAIDIGKKPNTVSKARSRGRIPFEWHLDVLKAAQRRDYNVTLWMLSGGE